MIVDSFYVLSDHYLMFVKDNKAGILDLNGDIVIPCIFKSFVGTDKGSHLLIGIHQDSDTLFYKGEVVFKEQWTKIRYLFDNKFLLYGQEMDRYATIEVVVKDSGPEIRVIEQRENLKNFRIHTGWGLPLISYGNKMVGLFGANGKVTLRSQSFDGIFYPLEGMKNIVRCALKDFKGYRLAHTERGKMNKMVIKRVETIAADKLIKVSQNKKEHSRDPDVWVHAVLDENLDMVLDFFPPEVYDIVSDGIGIMAISKKQGIVYDIQGNEIGRYPYARLVGSKKFFIARTEDGLLGTINYP